MKTKWKEKSAVDKILTIIRIIASVVVSALFNTGIVAMCSLLLSACTNDEQYAAVYSTTVISTYSYRPEALVKLGLIAAVIIAVIIAIVVYRRKKK